MVTDGQDRPPQRRGETRGPDDGFEKIDQQVRPGLTDGLPRGADSAAKPSWAPGNTQSVAATLKEPPARKITSGLSSRVTGTSEPRSK
jgi:hypothetical protein